MFAADAAAATASADFACVLLVVCFAVGGAAAPATAAGGGALLGPLSAGASGCGCHVGRSTTSTPATNAITSFRYVTSITIRLYLLYQ